MGRISLLWAVMSACVLVANTGLGQDSARLDPEVVDPKVLDAYGTYWDAFESYEAKNQDDGKSKFNEAWQKVRTEFNKEHLRISEEQFNQLLKAAAKYRHHLETVPDAQNRPYVILNLAQILAMLADHEDQKAADANSSATYREEAHSLLRDLEKGYPAFPMKDQGIYLRALLLEAQGQKTEAKKAWEKLSENKTPNPFVIHALIALGDHAFKEGRAGDAMQSYELGLKHVESSGLPDEEWERLRIEYRYVWASYRAGELDPVLTTGLKLLLPGRKVGSYSQRVRIESDAIQLIGDTLYETNNSEKAKKILRRKDIVKFASAIGYRVILRQFANGIFKESAQLGEWLAEEFPLADQMPAILQVTADSHAKLGKPALRLRALEKIALMLPYDSLWRAQHKDSPEALREMEKLARESANFVANSHYEQGLASGSVNELKKSASYFDSLLQVEPNGDRSNTWRLRQAHCFYFIGEYDKAKEMYRALKEDFKVPTDILQLAAYQSVQTDEKRWQDRFSKAFERGEDPKKNKAVVDALTDLEKSIDDFALRFPGQSRALDLLLVGGSANRDMERYDNATKFWQRMLVLGGTPAQRKIALRGLVFASMKTGSSANVVDTTRRILKTENFVTLGQDLNKELLGVLSTAAQDESKRLNDQGKVLEAGLLLTDIASEYSSISNRDRMYRDGSYMLAIAGEWGKAEKSSKDYFDSGLTKNRADMTYLLARANEYQLRLHESAEKYLELGEKYPSHSRAATSLDRAEKLALAEGDYFLAAKAAEISAEQTQASTERLKAYSRSVLFLEKADDPNRALSIARRRLRASRSTFERLNSRLLMARLTFQSGSEQEGLDELDIISKQIEKSKSKLSSEEFSALTGEVYILLGNEQKRKFDDFSILERGGDVDANISQKTKYFEDMVVYFDQAAAKGSPTWGAEARYKIASSADSLAREISSVAMKSDLGLTFKTKNRYQLTTERLQALTRRYLSANILASRKNPSLLKDNEWVRMSSTKLTSDVSELSDKRYEDQLPLSLSANQISEWSL